MAYQKCAKDVISLLKEKYTNKVWCKSIKKDKLTILQILLCNLGSKCLLLDDEICRKIYNEVYKGLTIANYIVPIMDIDIDPSLRQFNEYDKDYHECMLEEYNNNFKFNLT
jgi:hypothetical protein